MPILRNILFIVLLAAAWPGEGWAQTCWIDTGRTSPGTSITYADTSVDAKLQVWVTCTRPANNVATFRIKADTGSNALATSPFRSMRLSGTSARLAYTLRRPPDDCGDTTNWLAPATGDAQVIWHALSFFTTQGTEARAGWLYCVRVLASANQDPWPAAGLYTDTFNLFVQYPANDTGVTGAAVPVRLTVNVPPRCVVSPPAALQFDYASFSKQDVPASQSASLRCSNGLPWTATLDQNRGNLLGLDYTLSLETPSGTGTGLPQTLRITGLVRAGQAGTCASGTCTARQRHTLTVTY